MIIPIKRGTARRLGIRRPCASATPTFPAGVKPGDVLYPQRWMLGVTPPPPLSEAFLDALARLQRDMALAARGVHPNAVRWVTPGSQDPP